MIEEDGCSRLPSPEEAWCGYRNAESARGGLGAGDGEETTGRRRDRGPAGAAQIAPTLVGAPLLRRAYRHWGATPEEQTAPMPADSLAIPSRGNPAKHIATTSKQRTMTNAFPQVKLRFRR
jgi:hypothetical protein